MARIPKSLNKNLRATDIAWKWLTHVLYMSLLLPLFSIVAFTSLPAADENPKLCARRERKTKIRQRSSGLGATRFKDRVLRTMTSATGIQGARRPKPEILNLASRLNTQTREDTDYSPRRISKPMTRYLSNPKLRPRVQSH